MNNISALQEIGNIITHQIPPILSMLLEGKNIDLDTEKVLTISFDELKNKLPEELVIINTDFSGEINYPVLFLFKKNVVSLLTNLLMGISEEASDVVSETDLPIFQEISTQIFTSCGASLSSSIGKEVKVLPKEVLLRTLTTFKPNELFLHDKVVQFTYRININTLLTSNIYLVLPYKMIDELEKIVAPKEEPLYVEAAAAAPTTPLAAATTAAAAAAPSFAAPTEPTFPPAPSSSAAATTIVEETKKEAEVQKVKFVEFGEAPTSQVIPNIDLVLDVPLQISVELGRTKKSIKEILELSTGSIVELDKVEGEPVDVLANGKLFAKGEVVVIGETFGVRIVEILSPRERLSKVKSE